MSSSGSPISTARTRSGTGTAMSLTKSQDRRQTTSGPAGRRLRDLSQAWSCAACRSAGRRHRRIVARHLFDREVADQELGLVADGVLERFAAVDVEVADRVAPDLTARG